MTRTPFIAAAVLTAALGSTSAFAQEATPDTWTHITSTASAAEVRGEAAAALRAGQIERGEASRWTADAGVTSVKSRAQVRAEAVEALRLGLIDRGEASGPALTPAQAQQIRDAGLRAVATPLAQTTR